MKLCTATLFWCLLAVVTLAAFAFCGVRAFLGQGEEEF